MKTPKPAIKHHLIVSLFTWVRNGEFAIPEIQRLFGWVSSKVRDGMDSLCMGFLLGYVINGAIRMCGSRTVRPMRR